MFLKRNVYYRNFEKHATLFDDHELPVSRTDNVIVIDKKIRIPVEDLDFLYGAVAFKYCLADSEIDLGPAHKISFSLQHQGTLADSVEEAGKNVRQVRKNDKKGCGKRSGTIAMEIHFEIENDNMRPEFDVLKPYFIRLFRSKSVEVSIYAELRNGKPIAKIAGCDALEKLNREIIETVRFRFIEKEIIGKRPDRNTYHYFIDKNQESLDILREKIKKFEKYNEYPFQFRACDCNEEVVNLATAMHRHKNKYAALVLLDPFGMQIKWDSIQALQDTRTDIWILVPTGVIVNRLLDKEGELKHLKKLKSFFGMDEEEIRNFFYQRKRYKGLFGNNEVITKVSDPIRKIAELYIQQLGNIWSYVTEEPLVLLNSRNVPIFHFVFASNNKTALNIAKQIIGKG